MNKEKDKMTVAEVAEYMGVTRTSVYNWVAQGLNGKTERIPKHKKRLVFMVDDLMKYFDVQSVEELQALRKR